MIDSVVLTVVKISPVATIGRGVELPPNTSKLPETESVLVAALYDNLFPKLNTGPKLDEPTKNGVLTLLNCPAPIKIAGASCCGPTEDVNPRDVKLIPCPADKSPTVIVPPR